MTGRPSFDPKRAPAKGRAVVPSVTLIGRPVAKLALEIELAGETRMIAQVVLLGLIVSAQTPPPPAEHAANRVYRGLLENGWTVGSSRVPFPAPMLTDASTAVEEQAALTAIAGSERAAAEFTRDSVTAPFVLRTRDLKLDSGDVVRLADLWFVVRASLDAVEPEKSAGDRPEGQTVEAGNMRFTTRKLTASELVALNASRSGPDSAGRERFLRLSGRLLGRIEVEALDRVTATRTDRSWVVASQTEPGPVGNPDLSSRWRTREGAGPGPFQAFPGGSSYVRIGRLSTLPGALLVEAHFAFLEPRAWFDHAPILRSKFSVVAQDRIRALRRELAKSRGEGTVRSAEESKKR